MRVTRSPRVSSLRSLTRNEEGIDYLRVMDTQMDTCFQKVQLRMVAYLLRLTISSTQGSTTDALLRSIWPTDTFAIIPSE